MVIQVVAVFGRIDGVVAMMKTRAVEPGLLGVRVIGGRGVGF